VGASGSVREGEPSRPSPYMPLLEDEVDVNDGEDDRSEDGSVE